MLAVVIVLSLVVLVGAFWAARPAPHPVRWGVFLGFALPTVCLPVLVRVLPTVVVLLTVLLVVALRLWPAVRERVSTFVPLSVTAIVIAYGFACLVAMRGQEHYERLRDQYPYESMEDRVPAPKPQSAEGRQVATDVWPLGMEGELDGHGDGMRSSMLRRLHEDRVREFTNSPGFGVARILRPSETWLRPRPRGETPAQPPHSPAGPDVSLSATDEPDLVSLHGQGLLDFVNPQGFGYVKDRRHVAGFLPHAFSEVPGPARRWRVERLDLIGLLVHAEPVAYVSDRLPAMEDLRRAPTRKLDEFEATGLEVVRSGQILHIGNPDGRPRMLGAIRSAKQCVGCHGGERGDLLGAFSYTLAPATEPR
jgi:hypothetical protein